MKEFLKFFMSVKKIVTLMIAFVFCYLSLIGTIEPKDFMTIAVMVFGTYFGNSIAKKAV